MIFWWVLVVVEPSKLIPKIKKSARPDKNEIGEIFGVQSKKVFLARLFVDKPTSIKKFNVVSFNYSMQEYSTIIQGIVLDSYLLNQEKWVKILQLQSSTQQTKKFKKNVVYKISNEIPENIQSILDRFVGVIIENSDIGNIKFEYATKGLEIQEGDLVEVRINNKNVFYQIINGVTNKELLEAKNETGYIKAEALQLGVWNQKKCCFEKFGWVPEINSLVLLANTTIDVLPVTLPEFTIGQIPGTNFPAIINLDHAISHHTAVLGVTGSGKSFITRELIKNLVGNTKVICVDFTGEYVKELSPLKPVSIIHDKEGLEKVEELIAQKETASKSKALEYKKKIQDKLGEYISEFIEDKSNLALFELPELSNTSFILEFTQMFLDGIFSFAKQNPGQKICIVIEEAHTVIPETTTLGDLGDYGSNKALVNKIGQIALQGRKYGVGFLIIAQRTANVSKTVLTQCNSVICFQAFDKTSYDFLGNYLGGDLIKVLPNLKPFHAVVVGKAFKSNIPMIVDLTRNDEKPN